MHSTSRASITTRIVDDQRLDRQTLTRTLSGSLLLEDARPRMLFNNEQPRARGASTSICLPEKGAGSPWVTVPQHHGNAPISTATSNTKRSCQEDLLADDDGTSGILTLKGEFPSLSISDDDTDESLATLLPTPRGLTAPLHPARCSQVSQTPEKLKELHQTVKNEGLYENLLRDYGICRKEHPVTRRLSTSHAQDSPQVSQPASCPRPRRKSTSAYQISPSIGPQSIPPDCMIRISSILGTVTLSSAATPRELCLAAIAELEETQDALTEAWSRCCKTRQPIPPIQDLWNALYNFTFIIHLFTALTVDPCADNGELCTPTARDHDWLRPDIRSQCMAWRTPKQEAIHQRLGVAYNGERPASVDDHSNSNNDGDHHNKDHQGMYPLTTRQLKDLARICFEASHMLRPLTVALKALLPQQRELAWAKRTGRWSLFLSLKKVVQQQIDDCVRITHCPLTSWLRNARNQACEALGLDTSKVPDGEEGDKDGQEVMACGALQEHTDDLEMDDDDEENSGYVLEPGDLRRIRIRIMSYKAQYYLLCLLSPRCSPDKLEKLAAKVTGFLLQVEVSNIGDTSLRAELRDLRRTIMRRVEKTERKHTRRLGLVDSVICKITRRPLRERITQNIKPRWIKTFGINFHNDVYETSPHLVQPPMSTISSLEESTAAEEMSVEEVEMVIERMSPLHRC